MNDEITALEAELAGLTKEARTQPLLHLGQLYSQRWSRAGMGSTVALPYLEKSIRAYDEGYGYLRPDDALRGHVACQLGVLYGIRHNVHGGSVQDAEKGIRLIEESFESVTLRPIAVATGRMVLGQLYFSRSLRGFQSPDLIMSVMRSGAQSANLADIDRADDCFRKILSAPAVPKEAATTAQVMLTMTDAIRTLLGGLGGQGNPDLGRMMDAMAKMQNLQQPGRGLTMPGVEPSSLLDFEWTSRIDPLDLPVAIVTGVEPEENFVPRARPTLTVDVDAMRKALKEMLPEGGLYESVVSLLRSEELPAGIDDFVSLATSIVHSEGTATGTDHFLLAVGLQLRSRRDDDGGWGAQDGEDEDIDSGDVRAAMASLLTAAETIPGEQPDGVPALLFLATLLPGEVLIGLAERFTEVTVALRAIGAETLFFPEPAGALCLDSLTGRLEPAVAQPGVRTVVVVGEDAPHAAEDQIVSYVASTNQVLDLVRRKVRPVTEAPVFIANPRGDREGATISTMLLRRSFYPLSAGFGRLIENADGIGTPDEVRAHADASMLHLACGITTTGALELAGAAELDVSALTTSRGGLVILPPGHFLPQADTLLGAGYTSVIGWRRPVPEPTAALMLFVLHAELVDNGRSPAAAVRAVRRWYRAPDRKALPQLLAGYADQPANLQEHDWLSLVLRGR